MKTYTQPKIEILQFDIENVITESTLTPEDVTNKYVSAVSDVEISKNAYVMILK